MSSDKFEKVYNAYIDFDENGEVVIKKRKSDIPETYECHICLKRFVKKSYCQRHILSHEEMFECTVCQRKFTHNHHLNQHMRIHRPTKEYKCDICGMEIRFKFNIKKHMKTHIKYIDRDTGEIKYL